MTEAERLKQKFPELELEDISERNYKDDMDRDVKWIRKITGFTLLTGIAVLALLALGSLLAPEKEPLTLEYFFVHLFAWVYSFSRLLLVGIASFVALVLVGFLFGIPRSMQTMAGGAGSGENQGSNPSAPLPEMPPVNTNLEQVSDWLTKVLLGAGLTQLNTIPSWLWEAAGKLAGSTTANTNSQAAMLASIIYFGVAGFLGGYLLTRLSLAKALVQADIMRRRHNVIGTLRARGATVPQTSYDEEGLLEKVTAADGKYGPTQAELDDESFLSAVESLVETGKLKAVDRKMLKEGGVIELQASEFTSGSPGSSKS